MKTLQLTQNKVALLDDEDYELYSNLKWSYSHGYAVRTDSNNKKVYLHRVIMNSPSGLIVDHINRDKLDNQRTNLRICNKSENQINSPRNRTNTTTFKGVTMVSEKVNAKNRWLAQLVKDYKYIYLGYFPTAVQAAKAYDKKAKELFGEFAYTNF